MNSNDPLPGPRGEAVNSHLLIWSRTFAGLQPVGQEMP
jgi:hypothetical protein